MGQDMPDIQPLRIIVHGRNQPDLVPTDIKHGQPAYLICAGENTSQLSKIAKACVFDYSIPGIQGSCTVRVSSSEIQYFFPRYYVHACWISRYEILVNIYVNIFSLDNPSVFMSQ